MKHFLTRRSTQWISDQGEIQCYSGVLWITWADSRDYLLLPGQKIRLPSEKDTLLQALEDASFTTLLG